MKKQIYLIICTVVLYACTSNVDNSIADTALKNKFIIERMIIAYNNAAWESMESYYTDTIEFFNPVFRPEPYKRPKKALQEANQKFAAQTLEWNIDIMGLYTFEDKVIVEMDYTQTTKDSIFSREFICTIFTLKNGKIIKDAAYYNEQND